MDRLPDILARGRHKQLVLALDYDGTLTPIMPQPEQAVLGEAARTALQRLATLCTVAIISGRGLDDVKTLVGIEEIFYAGSHGFEIAGPRGLRSDNEDGAALLPVLDQAERAIATALAGIAGAHIERKKFSIAAHYRNVAPSAEPRVEQAVRIVVSDHPGLRMSAGKKVWEIQPDVHWNKGTALLWLLDMLHLDSSNAVPLYIGDDMTDEDAFRVLEDHGIAILVREESRPTAARYALESPNEVLTFISRLASSL